MERMLVVGASGLLGHDLCLQLRDTFETTGTFHSHPFSMDRVRAVPLDATRASDVYQLVREWRPDVLVLLSAMTAVDGCEEDPDAAERLNHKTVANVVSSLEGTDTKLVHVSTDYVFGGKAQGRYSEDEAPDPVSVYGRTKLAGERVALSRQGTLVVRVASLWGPDPREGRHNFVTWVLSTMGSGRPVTLFEDQWVTPTYTGAFARALPEMLRSDLDGIYHMATSDCLTRKGCGEVLADVFGLDGGLLSPMAMADAGLAATRPARSCLDTRKLSLALGSEMGMFIDDVRDFKKRKIVDQDNSEEREVHQ